MVVAERPDALARPCRGRLASRRPLCKRMAELNSGLSRGSRGEYTGAPRPTAIQAAGSTLASVIHEHRDASPVGGVVPVGRSPRGRRAHIAASTPARAMMLLSRSSQRSGSRSASSAKRRRSPLVSRCRRRGCPTAPASTRVGCTTTWGEHAGSSPRVVDSRSPASRTRGTTRRGGAASHVVGRRSIGPRDTLRTSRRSASISTVYRRGRRLITRDRVITPPRA
jgi:hypothetical protein